MLDKLGYPQDQRAQRSYTFTLNKRAKQRIVPQEDKIPRRIILINLKKKKITG